MMEMAIAWHTAKSCIRDLESEVWQMSLSAKLSAIRVQDPKRSLISTRGAMRHRKADRDFGRRRGHRRVIGELSRMQHPISSRTVCCAADGSEKQRSVARIKAAQLARRRINTRVATHSVSPSKRTLHATIPAPVAPRQRVSHQSRQTCRCVSGEAAATTRRTSSLAWLARRLLSW